MTHHHFSEMKFLELILIRSNLFKIINFHSFFFSVYQLHSELDFRHEFTDLILKVYQTFERNRRIEIISFQKKKTHFNQVI